MSRRMKLWSIFIYLSILSLFHHKHGSTNNKQYIIKRINAHTHTHTHKLKVCRWLRTIDYHMHCISYWLYLDVLELTVLEDQCPTISRHNEENLLTWRRCAKYFEEYFIHGKFQRSSYCWVYYAHVLIGRGIKRCFCLPSVCLSVCRVHRA